MTGALAGPGRWAAAERRRRWRATLALTLLVGLGGGTVLAALAGATRTETAFERFRAEALGPDARIQIGEDGVTGGLGPGGRAAFERVRALPEVERVAVVELFVGNNEASSYDVGIVAGPDADDFLGRPQVLEGRLPDPAAFDEVVTNEVTAAEAGLAVGDRFTVSTFTSEQLASIDESFTGFGGPKIELELVGVIRIPGDLVEESAGSFAAGPGFHVRHAGEAASFGGVAEVRFADGVDGPAGVERVREVLEADGRLDEVSVEGIGGLTVQVTSATSVVGDGLRLFAVAALLATVVACGQAISRRLADLVGDQAVLDALGCTRPQRAAGAVLVVAPVAALGAALAVVVAVVASPLLPIGVARKAEPDPGIAVDVLVLGAGALLVSLVVLALAAASAVRVSALHRDGTWALGGGRAHRSGAVAASAWAGASASAVLGVAMALEPGRGRTAVPVRPALAGAVLGTAGIVAALTFGASLDRLVGTPADYGWSFDLAPDVFDDGYEVLVASDEVADVGRIRLERVVLGDVDVQAMAVEVLKGNPGLRIVDGRAPAGVGEVAVGRADLERLDVGLGDRVPLRAEDGDVVELEVVGEALFPLLDGNLFDAGALVVPEQLEGVSRSGGFDQAVLGWREGVDHVGAEARLEEALPGALPVYAYPTRPSAVQNLTGVTALPRVLAGFLIAVALAAIGHALVAGVRRRRRDLAVVRVLGFVRRQVSRTVTWQSVTLAGIGLVAGVPLGLAAGRLLWTTVADGVGVAPAPVVPVALVALLVPATVAAAVLFAAVPARSAGRLRPADGLRVE